MKEKMYFESAGVSDIGRQRQYNEDALTASDELGLYAIADGMGGHMHGDVASRVTIETLLDEVTKHLGSNKEHEKQEACYETIANAIEACNRIILQKNSENDSKIGEGMGTTLVGAYFLRHSKQAIIFNVGDSRIYRLRSGDLSQITRDHTMYQEWVDAGEQGIAPSKNILVNAVGAVEELSADIKLEQVISGDMYVVCSDGLSGLVDDKILREFIHENDTLPVQAMCDQLIDLANKHGGSDNITVIIIRVDLQPPAEPGVSLDAQATMKRIESV